MATSRPVRFVKENPHFSAMCAGLVVLILTAPILLWTVGYTKAWVVCNGGTLLWLVGWLVWVALFDSRRHR